MKINLHVHKQQFSEKPTQAQAPKINNEVVESVSEVTPAELAQLVSSGHTMVLATMNGKRSKLNMIQQQALALDFDNKDDATKAKTEGIFYQSIEDTLEDPFIKENAAFIYKTFSHSEGWDKFRVVFILDEPMTSNEQVTGAYKHLMDLYPNADKAPKDSSRLFYGGVEATEINFNNTLETKSLPEDVKAPTRAAKTPKSSIKKETITPVALEDDEEPTWKLIQKGEKELVRERLSVYAATIHSKVQAMNYFKSLDMADVLGVRFNPTYDLFHFETSPSAGIFKMADADVYLYKCHSNSHPFTGDIIQVISKLTGLDFIHSINYLIEATGTKIEMTKQIHDLLEQCSVFQNTLLSPNLKDSYPAIHNRFWRYKTDINTILDLFKGNIYEDEKGNLRSLTWMSAATISVQLYGTKKKTDTIKRILNLMAYTEWIEKLDESQIPDALLKQIKANQNSKGYSKRSNVFELFNLGSDFFQRLNKQCEVMAEEGMTIRTLNKEGLLSANGKEVADKVFVQDKDRSMSKKTQGFYEDMVKLFDFHLENDVYILQNDLLDELQAKYKSESYVSNTYGKLIPQLLREKKAQKSRLTKALKEKWNLPSSKSSPTILFIAE